MAELPYLPLYVQDYEADAAHLSLLEDGCYMRLLRLCWRTPGCSIPDDPAWIMRSVRVDKPTFETVVKPILQEFFTRRRGRFSQKRLSREFRDRLVLSKKRVSAGRKGGEATRALKNNETGGSKAGSKQGSSAAAIIAIAKAKLESDIEGDEVATAAREILSILGFASSPLPSDPWHEIADHYVKWRTDYGLTQDEILTIIRRISKRRNFPKPRPDSPAYFDAAMHDHALKSMINAANGD